MNYSDKIVFVVNVLLILIYKFRDHYNEVLMQRWVGRFRDIFDADNYHPVQVEYLSLIFFINNCKNVCIIVSYSSYVFNSCFFFL
jgi:hypothetical protein